MKFNITGELELQQSKIEISLEKRLLLHGIKLGDLEVPERDAIPTIGTENCERLFFGESVSNPILFLRTTSTESPLIRYSLKLDANCSNIYQFAEKLNNKKDHTEILDIEFNHDANFSIFFYGNNFAFINHDTFHEFAVPFINNAFQAYYRTETSLVDYLKGSYGHDIIKKYLKPEKRARSPPLPINEFKQDVLNRDLIFMLVDEFSHRVKSNKPF